MKKTPLFSVVVTTHKRPRLLERALQSILAQRFTDVEIVLAADEGSAQTKHVAAQYLREDDVFLVLPHTHGPAETRNAGVQHAKGKYLLFLDDDDSMDSGFLEELVERTDFNTDAINCVNYIRIKETRPADDGPIVVTAKEKVYHRVHDLSELLVVNFIPNNGFVLAASIARQHGFDSHLGSHEDWDYLISLYHRHAFNFIDMYGPIVHINNGESRNNDVAANGERVLDFVSIYRKWPAPDEGVGQKRKETLKNWGLDLPAALL